jgi:predicted nucleic acid-binding protein
MRQGRIVEIDMPLALSGAKLSVEAKLPMADSLILATARRFDAIIWTQDVDFERLPHVNFRPSARAGAHGKIRRAPHRHPRA